MNVPFFTPMVHRRVALVSTLTTRVLSVSHKQLFVTYVGTLVQHVFSHAILAWRFSYVLHVAYLRINQLIYINLQL